jgi:parallel beta-helix repeat protein
MQFTATVRNTDGQPMDEPVDWQASGGTIDADGRYVAGNETGNFSATATSGELSATASITISRPPPPPPPPPPSGGIEVFPGEDIGAAVDANPTGTTFILKAGTHRRQSIWPKDGNTFIGEPGTVLDGENGTTYAFRSESDNVTIRNVMITRYIPSFGKGAIEAIWDKARGWVIEDCEVSYNLHGGITIGHNGIVRRCHIHHNGQTGIKGFAHDALIEDNEVSYNNTDGHEPNHEAGGMKIFRSHRLVVRNNHVHDNFGHGIWLDHDQYNCVIEGNLVEDNNNTGIYYEISYNGIIRNNTVRRNSWAIVVSSSPNVEVHHNTIADNNLGGVFAVQDNRNEAGSYGPFLLKDLWVHDNTIDLPRGKHGIVDSTGDSAYYNNNRFDRNDYNAHTNNPFWWKGDYISWAAWQADGQDPNGGFN